MTVQSNAGESSDENAGGQRFMGWLSSLCPAIPVPVDPPLTGDKAA